MAAGKNVAILALVITVVILTLLLSSSPSENAVIDLEKHYRDTIQSLRDENAVIDNINTMYISRLNTIKDSLSYNDYIVDSLKEELSNVSSKYENTYNDINAGNDSIILDILSRP